MDVRKKNFFNLFFFFWFLVDDSNTILDTFPVYVEIYSKFLNEIFLNLTTETNLLVNFSFQFSKRINYFARLISKMDYKPCFWRHTISFVREYWKNYFTSKIGIFYKLFYKKFEEVTIEQFGKTKTDYYLKMISTCSYFDFGQKDFDSFNDFAKIYLKCWETEVSPKICKIDFQIQEKCLKPFNEVLRFVVIEHKSMLTFFKLLPCPTKKYIILIFLKRILKLNDLAKYCIKKLFLNCPLTDEDKSTEFPCIHELKSIFTRLCCQEECTRRKFAKFVRENHEDLIDCFLLFKELTSCFINCESAVKYVKDYQENKKLQNEEENINNISTTICPMKKRKF